MVRGNRGGGGGEWSEVREEGSGQKQGGGEWSEARGGEWSEAKEGGGNGDK